MWLVQYMYPDDALGWRVHGVFTTETEANIGMFRLIFECPEAEWRVRKEEE